MTEQPRGAVSITAEAGGLVIRMTGEVDLSVLDGSHQASLRDQRRTAHVDMTDLTFMDSTGLAFLVAVRDATTAPPQLNGASSRVRRLLRVTGMEDMFSYGPSQKT